MITIHMGMACYYWLNLNFKIMIMIPPQIFGFMAYGSFSILNWASLKFIRQFAYDFFLVQHRIFAFMMLFYIYPQSRKQGCGVDFGARVGYRQGC